MKKSITLLAVSLDLITLVGWFLWVFTLSTKLPRDWMWVVMMLTMGNTFALVLIALSDRYISLQKGSIYKELMRVVDKMKERDHAITNGHGQKIRG